VLVEQSPLQHCALETQAPPVGRHELACAGVGATIELITGTEMPTPAPSASVCSIRRRETDPEPRAKNATRLST
jgi:hypothetical protein